MLAIAKALDVVVFVRVIPVYNPPTLSGGAGKTSDPSRVFPVKFGGIDDVGPVRDQSQVAAPVVEPVPIYVVYVHLRHGC